MTDRTLTPYEISVTDGESQYEVCQVLTVKRNGVTVDQHRDNGEPEDNCFYRDWRWVQPALEAAYRYGREDADKIIEAARLALAEVAADNDSEYGCSHADAAQQALDLIAGWKGPAATAGEMNPPASKAGLELAEQVLHYALFVGPGDMTIGEVVTMIERLFGPAVADALKDRHRPRETP
mgnify:FL=1